MDFSISWTDLEPVGMKKILADPQVALVDGKMELLKEFDLLASHYNFVLTSTRCTQISNRE